MNFVNPYIFAPPVAPITYNTEIGGVSATISSASALATKLGISVGRIENFTIVGSDIKCKITGSYVLSWVNDTSITYYTDSDGLVTSFNISNATNISYINFKGVINPANTNIQGSGAKTVILENATSIPDNGFASNLDKIAYYIPRVTNLGSSSGYNAVFYDIKTGSIIYTNPLLSTNNGGAPDGDITAALSVNGVTVRYVTNFTAPNPVTDLSAGTIYNTAIQLNFTPPTGSTNAIEYYECYVNGVLKNTITGSGQYITGLTHSTSYNITLKAVDIFYNKSVVSNSLSVSTTNRIAVDTDAIAYITASSNTTYQDIVDDMFVSLKSNSLYTKLQAFYPFLGTTATQHKWNAKNPLDTNAAFRLTFSGGGTHSNLGYLCNGTNSYANTYFVPSVNQNVNSNGLTLACGTNNAAASSNVVEIGSYVGVSQASYLMVKNNNTNYKRRTTLCNESPEVSQSGINESRGVFTGSRQSSTNTDLFVNGTQVATANQGGSLPNIAVFIGGLNVGGSGVTLSNQRIQFTAIHEGLSDAEVATFHTIIDTFEAVIGRKTW